MWQSIHIVEIIHSESLILTTTTTKTFTKDKLILLCQFDVDFTGNFVAFSTHGKSLPTGIDMYYTLMAGTVNLRTGTNINRRNESTFWCSGNYLS